MRVGRGRERQRRLEMLHGLRVVLLARAPRGRGRRARPPLVGSSDCALISSGSAVVGPILRQVHLGQPDERSARDRGCSASASLEGRGRLRWVVLEAANDVAEVDTATACRRARASRALAKHASAASRVLGGDEQLPHLAIRVASSAGGSAGRSIAACSDRVALAQLRLHVGAARARCRAATPAAVPAAGCWSPGESARSRPHATDERPTEPTPSSA